MGGTPVSAEECERNYQQFGSGECGHDGIFRFIILSTACRGTWKKNQVEAGKEITLFS